MKKPGGSLISFFSSLAKKHGGINLAQGIPGFHPPEELLLALERLIRRENAVHQYAPGNGDFRLLELLAGYYSRVTPLSAEQILVVQGATEGLSLLFLYLTTLLQKPFAALSFDPPYESYPRLPAIFDVPFEYFDLNEDLSIDFPALEQVLRAKNVKAVLISSPGNPLGKIWRQAELEALSELSEKLDFYLLFDAVYRDIYFKDPPYNPLALRNHRIFYINSFSKKLSITGWRIGYIICGREHMAKIRGIHDYTGLSAVTVFQRAIADYLERHNFGESYGAALREKCAASCELLEDGLRRLQFAVPEIEGGYFLWAELPGQFPDAFAFAVELYEGRKVALVPGENFSPHKRNYIRCNFATETSIIKSAVEAITEFCGARE